MADDSDAPGWRVKTTKSNTFLTYPRQQRRDPPRISAQSAGFAAKVCDRSSHRFVLYHHNKALLTVASGKNLSSENLAGPARFGVLRRFC
ncbi:hypothetical protein [Pantoea sp. App145]|uniref:hypothetical protein n=1 Tax=Pantoea sp. App145 TaxID=3071567 RepID=UPI003A80C500